jgi:myo-inositol 2-dehydrogenase/D-chiro-inositol 1-dehydrogenase
MAQIAVVGLGRMGLVHAGNLSERVPTACLARVADSDLERARRAGEALGVPWTTSMGDILGDDAVDGVVLATPTELHVEMIESAARHGKHVFVEKPIAFKLGSALRAIAAARAAKVQLQVGFQRRFDPDWRAAGHQLARGAIGDPRLLRVVHRNRAIAEDVPLDSLGHVLSDVAIHDFDTARWLIGEPTEITTIASSVGPDGGPRAPGSETVVITMRFANGALGVIDNTRTAGYGFECSGEVLGSEGALRIGAGRHPLDIEHLVAGEARVGLPGDHEDRHAAAYLAELEHFARVVLGELQPEPSGEDGAVALVIAEAARASLRDGEPVGVAGLLTSVDAP